MTEYALFILQDTKEYKLRRNHVKPLKKKNGPTSSSRKVMYQA